MTDSSMLKVISESELNEISDENGETWMKTKGMWINKKTKAMASPDETFHLKNLATAEKLSRLKALAEAEEASRLKALAEAEEASRLKALAEAEEASRLKALAEAEEASRLKALAEAEEASRLKALAEAEEASRLKALDEGEGNFKNENSLELNLGQPCISTADRISNLFSSRTKVVKTLSFSPIAK